MATNDMQTFLPLLQQPQVPVTPQAAPVPQPSADATLRRALLVPAPTTPAAPITADSLRASFAALAPYLPPSAQAVPDATAATPTSAPAAASISTPTPPAPGNAVAPAQAPLAAGNPQVIPGVNDAVVRAVANRVVGGSGAATPRVGRDATAPATVAPAAAALPAFAPGTPDLSQAPNSITYDDSGRAVSGRDGQGVEIIRGGVSNQPYLPGGGRMIAGRYVDPRDAIAEGCNQQLAYQQASISNLLNAFQHSDGLAATKHALAQAIGLNNFASVQGQGTNTINSAIGNVAAAGTGAGAAMYGANLNSLTNATRLGFEEQQAQTTPVQIGAEPMGITSKDGTFIPTMALPTYGMRGQGGAAPTPINPMGARTSLPPGLKVGAPYKGSDGVYNVGSHKVTIKSGQVAAIE